MEKTIDIYTYLKKDHKKVSGLFQKLITTDDTEFRCEIFKELYNELTVHSESEQKTFYKALDKTKKSQEEVEHAKEEHKEIKDILKKLLKPTSKEALWLIQLGELKSMVEHHVKEEETEIFPMAKKMISKTRAYALTEEMEAEKQKIKLKETI